MGKTDIFDDDLIQRRESVREVKMGPGQDPSPNEEIPVLETVPVRELSFTPLAKRKEAMNGEVARKMEELERLRARQDSLEREKNTLEHMRGNQEKYETGKRELIDRLDQSLVSLEREEIMLNRRLEVLQGTQKSLRAMDEELRELKENEWPAGGDEYREELTKALAILESMRKEYHKALSRLDAVRDGKPRKAKDTPAIDDDLPGAAVRPRTFGDWLLIGVAFNLFLVVTLGVLVVFLVLRYNIFFLP